MSCLFPRLFLGSWTLLLLTLSLSAQPEGKKEVLWVWSGGISDTQASVTAEIAAPTAELVYSPGAGQPDKKIKADASKTFGQTTVLNFHLADLAPNTLYPYRLIGSDGATLSPSDFTLKTFPPAGHPASFRFAFGSCNKKTDSKAFSAALHQKALFFLHTGDFHYANIGDNNPATFHAIFLRHLESPTLNTLLRSMPLFYMWDDHDYGPNDSNINNPSKEAAHLNYRTLVPHFPLTEPGTIDQAFTVGRVRFIMSDLRSERDPASKTMVSASQMKWLKAELLACKGVYPLIFWISSVPWNGNPSGNDRWQGYTAQRQEIADFVKSNRITGLCILSGDAHMTAIDDGSNSDFAEGKGAPIRVFQAGPLANKGSYKAGPYSQGARFMGEHLEQFGLVDVQDEGGVIKVGWSGRDGLDGIGDQVLTAEKDGNGLIELRFQVP